MLPRKHRLTGRHNILRTIRRGRSLSTAYVRIHLLVRAGQDTSRVAFIVSKKVHRSAVKRHTYQRWLRHISGALLPQLTQSYDMVWIAQPQIAKLKSSREISRHLAAGLKQLTQ